MKNFAKFQILGNIGSIEVLEKNEKKYIKISVAVNDYYKKDGDIVTKTNWFNAICFKENTVDYISEKFEVGKSVLLNGKIATSSYTKRKKKYYSTEFIIDDIQAL